MTLLGRVVFVLLLVAGPLIVFVFNLHHEKVTGTFRYGLLALQWMPDTSHDVDETRIGADTVE